MEPSELSGPDSGSQDVNPVFLQQLRELDIPEEAAKQVGNSCQHPGHITSKAVIQRIVISNSNLTLLQNSISMLYFTHVFLPDPLSLPFL